MAAIVLTVMESREDRVTFLISHQEVSGDFLSRHLETEWAHGWRIQSVRLPEVDANHGIFYIRGDNLGDDRKRLQVSMRDWEQIREAVIEFNIAHESESQPSLEEEFFSRVKA